MTAPDDPAASEDAAKDGERERSENREKTRGREKLENREKMNGREMSKSRDERKGREKTGKWTEATPREREGADERQRSARRANAEGSASSTHADDGSGKARSATGKAQNATGKTRSRTEQTQSQTEQPRRAPTDAGQLSLPLETLAVLNWLGDGGLDGAEDRLNTVLDDDLTVQTERVKVDYAEQETVGVQFDAAEVAGARVLLRKPLVGNVLVVFPMDSANKAAALMLQRAVEDLSSVSTEMGRDALTELCNMMANGFVDEWATLFETTIDTGSPVSVQAPERTLVRRILKQYEFGLHITSRLTIPEYDLEGTVYVFPGKPEFLTKMSRVGLEVIE